MTVCLRTLRALPLLLALALLAAVLAALPATPAGAAAPAACGTAAQNGVTVAATHGSAFYVDLKSAPKLDASYIGYRVASPGAARKDLWVSLDGFTGSSLSLANPRDAHQQIPVLASGASKTAYFLLKASAEATTAQSHVVSVWQGNPATTSTQPLYSCTFTFTKVQATIKAAANKVTSVTSSVSGTPKLGESMTITVKGNTGTIGQGSAPDQDIIWLSPTAFSSWPSRALRLQTVSLDIPTTKNTCTTATYVDSLLITGAKNCHSQTSYTASYTFTVIGRTSVPVTVAPVAQIASGTQYKHTDIGGSASAVLDLTNVEVPVVVDKTVTATSSTPVSAETVGSTSGSGTYGLVSYRITARTTSTSGLSLDALVDVPDSAIVYKAGSARVSAVGRSAEPLEPVVTTAAPDEKAFTGPFVVTQDVPFQLDYQAYVPLAAGTYRNHAYAVIGDQQVGADPSSLPAVLVTASDGSLTAVEGTHGMAPVALTQPAARVGKTTAALAGLVDANGTPTDISFRWGTTPEVVSGSAYTVVTADPATTSATDAVPVSAVVTGLSASTTYYYRVVAGAALGDVLSVTTSDPTSLEVTTTSLPDGVVAQSYSTALTYSGTPVNPVRWAVVQGSLPAGLSLSSGGALSGTPTTGGTSTFTVEVADGDTSETCTSGCAVGSATATLSLLVRSSVVAPVVTTLTAGDVTDSSAVLLADVATGGAPVTVQFEVSLAEAMTGPVLVAASPSPLPADGTASGTATGLQPSTTYWFRARATSTAGSADGAVRSFTTGVGAVAPRATTLAASSVGTTSATVSGSVDTGGGSTTLTFTYGTASGLTGGTTVAADPGVRSTDGATGAVLAQLLPATTYYYRLDAHNSAGAHSGETASFTTAPLAPEVVTVPADAVTASSAVVGASLTSTGGAPVEVHVEWGTASALADAASLVTVPGQMSAPGSGTGTLSGLAAGTAYYFRAVATGPGGSARGEVLSFTTSAAPVASQPVPPAPVVTQPAPAPVPTYVPVAPPAPAAATESGSGTSMRLDGTAEATAGPLVATGTGMGGITVGRLPQQTSVSAPGAGPGSYFSVDVDGENRFDEVELRLTEPSAGSLFWWDGSAWKKLPGTLREGDSLVVVVDGTTRPGLADLPGLQLAYGTTPTARLSGTNRQQTAIAASRAGFPEDGSARSVVLARSDVFADALTGGPLAVREQGPILLTATAALDPDVAAEVRRVLGPSGTVYLLGLDQALAPAVADAARKLGYRVVRLGGGDRYATAVTIAQALGDPDVVFEATGLDFADAVAAGAAAVAADGAVLLTAGDAASPATTRYLAGRAAVRYAVGGGASAADAGATPLVGRDRYDTAVLVAERFFPRPSGVGIAVGSSFPDPLVASPYLARQGHPILLVGRTLGASASDYLQARSAGIGQVTVFGGTAAVAEETVRAVTRALP